MMQQYPVTAMATVDARSPVTTSALCDVLASETRLLNELIAIMRRQRDAVAQDDLATVDDSVFATQRVLRTLNEARRRRHAIYRMLGAPEHAGARVLTQALGPAMTPELSAALDALMTAAQALSREVEVNRTVLRKALAAGDDFVRALAGAGAPAGAGYGTPSSGTLPRQGAMLLDRQG